MRHVIVPLALLVGSVACSRGSQAPPGDPVAPASRSEVVIPSGELRLRGWVLRPEGAGPFPAIVYNHGSEKDPSLDVFAGLASFFQEHGYVVVLPFRRGSGGSDGAYWEDGLPPKTSPDYGIAVIDALEKENADVSSAIAWARALPYVDPARVSVAGCSFGGIHALLAAEKRQGLHAAVDFAGASMSWSSSPVLQRRLTTAVDHGCPASRLRACRSRRAAFRRCTGRR